MAIKEIKLIARTGKTKEGKPFTSFKAVQKDGKLIGVHFRKQDSEGKAIIMPSASCTMVIDSEALKINKSKQYPELWVHEQPEYQETTNENSSKAVEEMF